MKKPNFFKSILFTAATLFLGSSLNAQCSFTGLDTAYCANGSSVALTGSAGNGVFTGPGISGNNFDPTVAGPGDHEITYSSLLDGDVYYLRAQAGEPWSSTSNTDAMDLAFGAGAWTLGEFETLTPATVFSTETKFVFMDGSDNGAQELATFLTANMTAIETWVYNGGRLFMNAGPNEGGNIDFGFNGSTLIYADASSSVDVVDLNHPAFVGPNTPVAATMTGSSYSHAHITGSNFTSVVTNSVDATNIVVCEKQWGAGRVMMGGMTTSNYHSPLLEANNFRANLLDYMGNNTNKFYLRSNVGEPWGSSSNTDAMNTAFVTGLWTLDLFESLDPSAVFSSKTSFVLMDGSDTGAQEMEAFLTANQAAIEAWVNNGGSLLINAAPNEGGDIDLGFNGSTLVYDNAASSVDVMDLTHPAYLGPNMPTAPTMTGGSYSHAHITGTGFSNILEDSSDSSIVVLCEKPWGFGNVMMGGMTTSNYHSPTPEAHNFRANLLVHMSELYAGSYCVETQDVSVLDPIVISVVTDDEMFGNDGAIDITVTGGHMSLDFDWDNDGTGDFDDAEDISGLSAGNYVVTVEDEFGCMVSETVTVNSQVGIDTETQIAMKVYPNPTVGETVLEVEGEFTFVLTDINGKLISQGNGVDQETIQFTGLENGVYFIEVATNLGNRMVKVVKK